VGTGFNNWAMPLIRYRTGDIAVVGPKSCSCGRHYPLWERIEGRLQEYIVASDGKLVSLTAFIFGQHYHAFERIKRMQIIQNRPGAITVRLMVVPKWTTRDEGELMDDMSAAIGDDWEIEIEYVDNIELTARGKHRFVIQNLSLPDVWAGAQAK
jgi:phenylacetate-CoA ligase